MSLVVYDNLTKRVHKAKDVELVDKVVDGRKKKDPWEVIDELVKAWSERTPEEFQAFKVHLQHTREDLKDKRFGTTQDKNMDRRLTLMLPLSLMGMIRSLYKVNELPMDKKFYKEFAGRYKFFQIPEKL